MADDKNRRKRLSRRATVALKAEKLGKALHCGTPFVIAEEQAAAETEQPRHDSEWQSIRPLEVSALETLKAEIGVLRHQLAEKTAEYRVQLGDAGRAESQVVRRVLELLSQPDGATKTALIGDTGAKRGYIDALLNRILPARGHVVQSFPVEGARTRAYRISIVSE